MDLYFERHDGQAVTTEDFLSAMSDANDEDLSQFALWYSQAGTPEVRVVSSYDSQAQTYTLEFTQSCPDTPETKNKKPFIIPIKYGLIDAQGDEIEHGMFTLDDVKNVYVLDNIEEEPTPSLLRDFSAPVKLYYDYSHSDYAFLMQHDSDDFNRFEAAQKFALEILVEAVATNKVNIPEIYFQAFENILQDKALDNSLKAEAIMLPSETMITETIKDNINPVQIHELRESMMIQLAQRFETTYVRIYQELS